MNGILDNNDKEINDWRNRYTEIYKRAEIIPALEGKLVENENVRVMLA